jgi:hypothetical protein
VTCERSCLLHAQRQRSRSLRRQPRGVRDGVSWGWTYRGWKMGKMEKWPPLISEEEILKTVREYRSGRKKLPEITVVARTKKKTA